MNTSLLFKQFNAALNWNTYYYLVYKCSFTIRTLLLYNILTTQDFSLWATTNSTIYLILLWADCGLRKSIPRYAPLFANHRAWFFGIMMTLQMFILFISFPLIIWLLRSSTQHTILIIISLGIFIAEGIINTIKLTYHAYFDNRSFNIMAMSCTSLEMLLTLAIILLPLPSYSLLIALFITKLISSWLLVIISTHYTHNQPSLIWPPPHTSYKPFAVHTLIMWGTTILKSLSERNFLVPFFTQTMGPVGGNLFKVANDSALLGYRLILKTIGSADTALLAHVQEGGGGQDLMNIAVKKLTTTIARLCIPLLGILVLIALYKGNLFYKTPFVFHAFLIMGIGYIIETSLLPYERVLEVKQNYKALLICYIPYVCMLIILITSTLITSIGFINTLICIHGVRLVSCLMMRSAVYRIYGI